MTKLYCNGILISGSNNDAQELSLDDIIVGHGRDQDRQIEADGFLWRHFVSIFVGAALPS